MNKFDPLDSYLEKWQKDLIDLSRRNRLINLARQGNVLSIDEPSYGTVLGRLSDPSFKGWRFHYPPPDPEKPETVRRPAHVSPDEVKLALFFLVKDARSITEGDLALQTARLFGWKRTGSEIRTLISRSLEALKQAGDVVLLESGLLAASDSEFPDLS